MCRYNPKHLNKTSKNKDSETNNGWQTCTTTKESITRATNIKKGIHTTCKEALMKRFKFRIGEKILDTETTKIVDL